MHSYSLCLTEVYTELGFCNAAEGELNIEKYNCQKFYMIIFNETVTSFFTISHSVIGWDARKS